MGGISILIKHRSIMILILLTLGLLFFTSFQITLTSTGWRNGPSADEFSQDSSQLKYGTHDWIAEHALDFLADEEKQYILTNLETYLYGTELPDKATGADAIGDTDLHHYYLNESGVIKDDSAGQRATQEYLLAEGYIENGDLSKGLLHLGVMTHYIADMAAFGYVMNDTYWGSPNNSTKYINDVNSNMTSYSSEFNNHLHKLTGLGISYASDGALLVAQNTTFNPNGYRNCTWMDANYNWLNISFKSRCGESLNLVVNVISSLLHNFYKYNISTPSQPTNLATEGITGHIINLSWSANPEYNIMGYSIFINKTDSTNTFKLEPIANVTSGTKFSVVNLNSETPYSFRIQAYNIVGKKSQFSDIVQRTTLDVTPPGVPSVRELPEHTNKPELSIFGFAEQNSTVEVFFKYDLSSPAGTDIAGPVLGEFRIEITLDEGENNITTRAVDESGNPSAFAPYQIVVLDSISPVADAGADIEINKYEAPVMARFDGSNSTDNQGNITNYTWTVDLKSKLITLFGVSPIYYFEFAGEFTVILNVTDKIDNWNTDQIIVRVIQLDYSAPYVVSQYPPGDSKNQSINVTIEITFNEPLDVESIKISIISNVTGELQIPRPDYDPKEKVLTLKPFENLTHDTRYTVIITATDLYGNQMDNASWHFTTKVRPADFDADDIPDKWEMDNGLNPDDSRDAFSDLDGDGLSNFDEYNKGVNSTDPQDPDTDGDGMTDLFERQYKLNPVDPSDRDLDPDSDGRTNYEEYLGDDGQAGNTDWTDPNTSNKDVGGKTPTEDDYMWAIIAIVVILIIIVILILLLRKVQYKQTTEIIKDDDGYLKTKDAKELGIGGNIILEDPNQYVIGGKTIKPGSEPKFTTDKGQKRYDRSKEAEVGKGGITPGEILERARKEETTCPKCGAGLPNDTNYCFECGTIFDEKKK